MQKLINVFRLNTVHRFSMSTIRQDHVLTIVVKSHFRRNEEVNEKGIKYYLLDDNFKIISDEMTQSWDALSVWFKAFNKHEVIGTYNFDENIVETKK